MFTWFKNLKTMAKLMLGFALVGGIMACVGWLGVRNMGVVMESTENIYNTQLKPLMTLTIIRGMVHQTRANTITAVLTQNPADREEALGRVRDFTRQIDETREAFAKTIKAEDVQKAYDEVVKIYDDYRTYRDNVIFKALQAGDSAGALAALKGDGAAKFKASVDAINRVVDVKMKVAQRQYDDATTTIKNSKMMLTGIILGGVAIGLFLGWVIARMISNALRQVNDVAQCAAEGNLTKRVDLQTKDELGQLGSAFNSMMDKLAAVVSQVRQGAATVASAAAQISTGAQDLSQRTSEQASALEETSSAMEEMTSTVKQNADNAKQANQLAVAARDVAEKGGAVTRQAVGAMDEINKSSKKIADIINVIDEIAFQTNLLALNAAVEAARAGEQGRGFAVVAAEVRNLAQRSATAAKEIKGLINESVQKVTDGSDLVNQSGKTLEEIVSSVKRVTDIIAEIAAASQEQSSGIDQVNKAIIQMDETTQQNAALVEESASASEGMQQQAAELLKLVEFFKVDEDQHGGVSVLHTGRPAVSAAAPPSKPAAPKSTAKKLAPKPPQAEPPQPVGVGLGNGHDRRRKDDTFEEF